MSGIRSLAVGALVALMAGSIVADYGTSQTAPQAPPQQPPIFRTGTEVVRVDATVFDKNGKPVTDLSEADFEVQEDGVTQPIKSFKLVEVSGMPPPDSDESLAIRSREHAALEAAKDDVRLFLIFWDDYHIGEFQSTLYARTQLAHFLLTAFGPTDLVGIMDPLTPTDAIVFSRDRRQLADAAARLQGRRNVYTARSVLEEGQLTTRNVDEIRSQVTTGAIVSALVHLGAMKEGRKSLILFTEGAQIVRSVGATDGMSEIVRSANASNTAVYTVDPRGVMMGSTWLESVAADTGGEWIRSNDMESRLRRVVQQSTAFYLIGYDATMSPKDGRFHKIKVRVKRPGLQVRSRGGFWAPTVGDLVRARAAVRQPPAAVTEAVTGLVPQASPRAADVWVGVDPKTTGQARVMLMWARRAGAGAPAIASAELAVTGEKGPVFAGPVDGGVTFDAPPGAFSLALTFRNAAGEVVDKELRSIVVPDMAKSTLEIGSPVVLKAANALELRALQAEPDAAPFPGREFVRSDRLLIRFRVHGAASQGVTPTARLLNAEGVGTTTLAVRRDRPEAPFEIDLPLSSLAPAAWIVAIEARSSAERREVMVPFRLVR